LTAAAIDGVAYPTTVEVLNQVLNDIKYAYETRGLVANVGEGSDNWIRSKAFANRISIAFQNNKLSLADLSARTAVGEGLEDYARVFGITRRVASHAAGFVEISCTGTVVIPIDYACAAPNGERYTTITANTVDDGDLVEVIAVNAGEATNQDAGTLLQWESSAVGGLSPVATVDDGEIDGGEEEDDDETLRDRLIRRLSTPALGGTAAQVAQFAEEASAAVEQAYVHAAVRGPGSYDVVVTKAGGDRTLSATIVSTVDAAVRADFPGFADLNTTSVTAEEVDVILNMTLPLPVIAGGAGGGWRDSAPWPSTADSALAKVTVVGGSTITVNSTNLDPPVAGKRFGIWDPVGEEMLEFTITTVTGVSGAYVITPDPAVSSPLTNVVAGAYCSAGAISLTTYAEDFADAVALLGPGEKTTNVNIIPRGRRQPSPDTEKPAALTTLQLAGLTRDHTEILNLEYQNRYATGTTTTLTSPSVPATTADPTNILVLKFVSFRRQA
jgi:uncharacterized phage protein gp47/JayE